MYEKFGQFIEGKWQQSEKKETYEVINPATEEVLGHASKATSTDVDKALKSAEKGLEVWKKTPPWKRSSIIRKIADLIRKKQDVLAKWMTLEVGKPLAEGKGEAGGSADIFEWNSEETKRIYGQTVESRFEDTRVHVYYQPVGVVAALVPWNFPLILASRKISTALAAGCSVICKPDVITPGTVMELVDICREAGVPPGVVNLLSGDPPSIASQLISSSIFFTPSSKDTIGCQFRNANGPSRQPAALVASRSFASQSRFLISDVLETCHRCWHLGRCPRNPGFRLRRPRNRTPISGGRIPRPSSP